MVLNERLRSSSSPEPSTSIGFSSLVSVTRATASLSRSTGRIAERAMTKPIALDTLTPRKPKIANDQPSVAMMLFVGSNGRPSTSA